MVNIGCKLTDEDIKLAVKYVDRLIEQNKYSDVNKLLNDVFNSLIGKSTISKALAVSAFIPEIVAYLKVIGRVDGKFATSAAELRTKIDPSVDGWLDNLKNELGIQSDLETSDFDFSAIADSVDMNSNISNEIIDSLKPITPVVEVDKFYNIDGVMMRCKSISGSVYTMEYFNGKETVEAKYNMSVLATLNPTLMPTIDNGTYVISVTEGNAIKDVAITVIGNKITKVVYNDGTIGQANMSWWYNLTNQRGGVVRYYDETNINPFEDKSSKAVLKSVFTNTQQSNKQVTRGNDVIVGVAIVKDNKGRTYSYLIKKGVTVNVGDYVKTSNGNYLQVYAVRRNINGYTVTVGDKIWNVDNMTIGDFVKKEDGDMLIAEQRESEPKDLVLSTDPVVTNISKKLSIKDNKMSIDGTEVMLYKDGSNMKFVYPDGTEVMFDTDGNIVKDGGKSYVFGTSDNGGNGYVTLNEKREPVVEASKVVQRVVDGKVHDITYNKFIGLKHISYDKPNITKIRALNSNGKTLVWVTINGTEYKVNTDGNLRYDINEPKPPAIYLNGDVLYESNTNKIIGNVNLINEIDKISDYLYDNDFVIFAVSDGNGGLKYTSKYKFVIDSTIHATKQNEENIESNKEESKKSSDITDANEDEFADEISDDDFNSLFPPSEHPQTKSIREIETTTTEQQKEALEWFNELGFVKDGKLSLKVEDITSPYGDNVVATWTNRLITLYNGSDNTSLYHEAFHELFNMYLTHEQRTDLYNELRARKGKFVNHNGNEVSYKKASDVELEEKMSEEFRTYMLTGKLVDGRTKLQKFFDKLRKLLSKIFSRYKTKAELHATIKSTFENLKKRDLTPYEKNYNAMNSSNIVRTQTILQKNSYISIDKLDTYKIGNKSLKSYALDIFVNEYNKRAELKGAKKITKAKANERADELLSKSWAWIRDDVAKFIERASDGEITTSDDKTLYLKKNGEIATELSQDDIEAPEVAKNVNDGFGLNAQYTHDVNQFLTSMYVGYMNQKMKNDNMSFIQFRNLMATEKYQQDFFTWCRDEISDMLSNGKVTDEYRDVFKFVIDNFGNTVDIKSNLVETNGVVYGVVGYFMKHNKMLFSKTVAAEDVESDVEEESQTQFITALMDWNRSGDETRLADLLKDEIKIIISTIGKYSQVIDETGGFVEENGSFKMELQKNKFSGFSSRLNGFMNEFENPRAIMNKIQELVKDTPSFESFIKKFYDAVFEGEDMLSMFNGESANEKYKDPELREVFDRLGGITDKELENKKFDNPYKAAMWRMFYQSFNNAQVPGKLVRIEIDYGRTDAVGDFKIRESIIDGSAADNDAANVLDSWFKNDMYKNFNKDIFTKSVNATINDRLSGFAKTVANFNVGKYKIYHNGDVMLFDSSAIPTMNELPDNLRYALSQLKEKFYKLVLVKCSDDKLYGTNKQSEYKALITYKDKSSGEVFTKSFNQNVTLSFEVNERTGENTLIAPVEFDAEQPYTIEQSFIANYINNGIKTTGNYLSRGIDTRAVCGMLLLNGVSMDTIDSFNQYLYKREGVTGYEYVDEDGKSHTKRWGYHLETACGTYNESSKAQRAINARIKMLNALGLYPHRTQEFERYLADESTRFEVQSVLENLFDKAMSEDPIETSLRDVFADGTQANYMMKNIVDMEKKYINNMASFSQRTGDNTNFFENTLNNTMSVLVNSINDILDKCTTKDGGEYKLNKTAALEMINQTPALKWFNTTRNPMLKHSIIYRVLFTNDDGTFGRSDPNKQNIQNGFAVDVVETKNTPPEYVTLPEGFRLELSKLSGTEVIENENYLTGSNAYQSDELTRYSNDILLAVEGIFSPIQHSDKKSVWALGLNRGFNTSNRSRSYIDLSYCYYDENSSTYDKMADILLDKAIGEVEYIVGTVTKYREGRIGKADYRVIQKMFDDKGNINFSSSIVYDIISRTDEKLADKLFKAIESFISSNPNGTVKELRDAIGDSINGVINSFKSYFESEVSELMKDYGDFYIGDNKISQIKNKIKKDVVIPNDQFRTTLMRHYFLNNFVHAMEMCTLMYGNLLNYKPADFVKRVGAFGSTGSLTDSSAYAANEVSEELSDAVEKKAPATYIQSIANEIYGGNSAVEAMLEHKSDIQKSLAWSDTMRTLVVSDVKRVSAYATEYARILTPGFDKLDDVEKEKIVKSLYANKYDEADAFAVISFDKYRQYLKFENKWTAEHEALYKKIVNGEKINPLLVNKLFMPIKAQYIGAMNSTMDNVAFHKYQLFPLVPTIYEKNSIMDKLHKKMLKEGIDYVTFKSGSKVADVTDYKGEIQSLDVNGELRDNLGYNKAKDVKIEHHDNSIHVPFDKSENDYVDVNDYYIGNLGVVFNLGGSTYFAKLNQDTGEFEDAIRATDNTIVDDYTTEIYAPFLKDQLVIHDEFENEIVLPTQMRKLLVSNFFNEGVPVDYKGRKNWNNLKEDEKIKASPMYSKTVNYVNALRDLRNYKKNELLKKLCVIEDDAPKVDENGNYVFDKAKLSKWVNELIENEELPDEFKRFFKLNSNGDFDFDIRSSLNISVLEKAIVSKLDKEVTQFRVYGETLIQAPNTLFEKRVQFTQNKNDLKKVGKYAFPKNGTNGLRFYELDANGNVVSMKVKIPMSGKFRCLLELEDVVNDSEVISGSKTKLQKLNELLQNEEWFSKHKDMLTMISVRIPTQGHNSIEMMEVFEFLPPEGPNSIILPSEIVVKSGGDYDIDKMPIMMPHISKIYRTEVVGDTQVIKYDISSDKSLDSKTVKQSLRLANVKLRNDVDLIVKDSLNHILNNDNVNVLFEALDYIKRLELQRSQILDTYHDDMEKDELDKFKESKNDIEVKLGSARSDIVRLCDELLMMLPETSPKSDVISTLSDYLLVTGNIYASESWHGILREAKKSDAFKGEDEETIFEEKLVSSGRFGTITLRRLRDYNTDNREKLTGILLQIASEVIDGTYGITDVDQNLVDSVITDRFDIESNTKLIKDYKLNGLENKLHETILDILRDNSTFRTLITPNSTNVYDYVKSKKSSNTEKKPADLVNPRLNNQERLKFVAGKESLGIAAVDNTTSVIFKQIGLALNDVLFREDDKGNIITTNIKVHLGFKHNKTRAGNISLSKISDASGSDDMIHNIQNKINQIINGFVDVAKDPWVKNIGGDKTRTPILLFMINAGVSVEDAVALLTNDKVREYCEELERSRNDVTSDDATTKFDIFKKIFPQNSALGEQIDKGISRIGYALVNVPKGKKPLNFRADRYSLAAALEDIKFNSDSELKLSSSGVTNLYYGDTGLVNLSTDELAVLEFINIKFMADDLTEIKIRISQDTKTNDTATDIDLLSQDNMSVYFDLDKIDVSNTPVGPFNDKGFISGVMNAFYKNDNMYSRIHSWVIDNQRMIKGLGLGTVGEVEHMLINTYNMMMYQRSLKGSVNMDIKDLFESFIKHDYPTDGNISSIDEYSLYVANKNSVTDIPPYIKNVLYNRYLGMGYDSTKSKKMVGENANEYMALFNIYNHDFLFKSEFSFANIFEYLKNRCPKLQSMSLFNLLRATKSGGDNLLVLNSNELEDIDAIRADIENLKSEKYIKDHMLEGIAENEKQSVIDDILFFANNIEKFAMLQSDNSIEGVFGISKLGDDVERAELISTQEPIDVAEVFYNMLSNQGKKVAKLFDGYIKTGEKNGIKYIEINGVRYNNDDLKCLERICGINGEFKSKHIDLTTSIDSQLNQISAILKNFRLSPYRYFDMYDIVHTNIDKQYIFVGGIFYERDSEGQVRQLKEVPSEMSEMLPKSNLVVSRYPGKVAKETGAIDTTKYYNTSEVTYANPFKYDDNLKNFMEKYHLSLSDFDSLRAYDDFVSGKSNIIVRFTDAKSNDRYIAFNTQFKSIEEVDTNGYSIKGDIPKKYQSIFVTRIAGYQKTLTEQIATGVLRGRDIVTNTNRIDSKTEYSTENPSSAMILQKYINNPNLLVSLNNNNTMKVEGVTFEMDLSEGWDANTTVNGEMSDVTLVFAYDFDTYGEKLTKKVSENYKSFYFGNKISDDDITDILSYTKNGKLIINVAGNLLDKILKAGSSQDYVDTYIESVLRQIKDRCKDNNIQLVVRSGGQTGADEAGIKAAMMLGVPAICYAPRGWRFKPQSKDGNFYDKYDEEAFKKRFDKITTPVESQSSSGEKNKNLLVSQKQSLGLTDTNTAISKNVNINSQNLVKYNVGSVIKYNGNSYAVLKINNDNISLKSIDKLYEPVISVNMNEINSSDVSLTNNRVVILNYNNIVPDVLDLDSLQVITRDSKGGFVKTNLTKKLAQKYINVLSRYFSSSPNRLDMFLDIKKSKGKDSSLSVDVWNMIADKIIDDKYNWFFDTSILGSVLDGLADTLKDGVDVNSFERDITDFKKLGVKNVKGGITLDKLSETIAQNMIGNVNAINADTLNTIDDYDVKNIIIDVLSSANSISELRNLDKNNIKFRTQKLNDIYKNLDDEFRAIGTQPTSDNDFYGIDDNSYGISPISYGDDILFVPEVTSIDYRDGFTSIRLSEYKSTDACLSNITSVLQNGGKVIVYNDLIGESEVNLSDVCNFLATYNGVDGFESNNFVSSPRVSSELINEQIKKCINGK